jgi:RNA polymerase sigma-70 factor (ECF subfamily)
MSALSAALALRNATAEFADVSRAAALEQKAEMENSTGPEFQALVRRFEIPLLQYATRIIGDRERARDVVQETFVQLERSRRDQNDNAPAKWLFTVCRNRALNVCRKEQRLTFLDDDLLGAWPTADADPAEQLEQKEAGSFLLRIVSTLPPRQQEVLQLKFQNDLSYQEISEITNLSVSNVGVLIHNALKTLRLRYAKASREFVPFTAPTKP